MTELAAVEIYNEEGRDGECNNVFLFCNVINN